MAAYATVGAIDAAASHTFHDAVLKEIGWGQYAEFPGWRGYSQGGTDDGFVLWVCTPFDGEAATAGNGSMVGFIARSTSAVDAFYRAAIANGGSDAGAAGPRPQYGPHWYAAYVRDPGGNKIAAVYNG